ncbi:MAG: 2-amino-4-hydroxy-6-hydroxymethyldihydropteridine diphosphokinase [Abditibacteriota bacterium]|nr:2-amino-4-hydroxy-6-hydroxymethyldihydropteridine diphosphokinase [Abditibacteriota bacterium]
MTHVPVLLALGSNLGNRQENIKKACALLASGVTIEKISSLRETRPLGVEDQPDFINGALYGKTGLTPRELLCFIKETEKSCGRYETYRWGPRVIDIDIIFYDNIFYRSEELVIPHRELKNRDFVTVPALEVIPQNNDLIWKGYITGTA